MCFLVMSLFSRDFLILIVFVITLTVFQYSQLLLTVRSLANIAPGFSMVEHQLVFQCACFWGSHTFS